MSVCNRLISGGDTITLWEGNEYDRIYSYKPTSGSKRVICNSWNNDGTSIASCIEGSDQIILTYPGTSGNTSIEVECSFHPIRVQYPRSSFKYLILGSTDKVHLFDVGKKKVKKEFSLPTTIHLTSIASNFNSSYIAVGGSRGNVLLINAVTGNIGIPMKSAQLQDVTAVRYSNIRHSVLASSGESGSVALWDCNANKLTHTFAEHKAPATGLSFSPVNDVLFLSSGLDKRCICYDNQSKRAASTIRTDYPLECVDLCPDGMTLALGTITGKILIYDLRAFKIPVKILSGHAGSVKSVLYQPPVVERSMFGSASKSSMKPHLSKMSSKKNLAVKENLPSISENSNVSMETSTYNTIDVAETKIDKTSSDRRESLSMFSPIRDNVDMFSPQLSTNFNIAPSRNSLVSNSRMSTDSIFSPLKENSVNSSFGKTPTTVPNISESLTGSLISPFNKNDSLSSLLPTKWKRTSTEFSFMKNLDGSIFPSPLAEKGNSTTPVAPCELHEGASGAQPSVFGSFNQSSNITTSVWKDEVIPVSSEVLCESDQNGCGRESKRRRSSVCEERTMSNMRDILTAFPDALDAKIQNIEAPVNSTPCVKENDKLKEAASIGNSDIRNFQEEYIRGIVRDAMDDFCSDMRRHLWHIHYNMISNFDRQREEMKKLLSEYAVNETLALEVERLRKENEALKRSPFVLNLEP